MHRIAFAELQERAAKILVGAGVAAARAEVAARLIAETDRDGVRTHGIARLPRMIEMIRLGRIDPKGEPELVLAAGALERWRGRFGLGNLAAQRCTERACELARVHGVGCVALGETTHWMRGGTYGWQAAERGFALMAWTNTLPNLPPWGASSPALGNNPLIVAVPRFVGGEAAPVVLDIAMSQFSYGALDKYAAAGEALPAPGGFDAAGELTTDAAAIVASQRALPIGFWKGSGLAFVMDLLGAMLAGGKATHQIPRDAFAEIDLSQVFLAVSPEALGARAELDRLAEGCIESLHAATPVVEGRPARYPGEGTLAVREESERLGVGVEDGVWAGFLKLEVVSDLLTTND